MTPTVLRRARRRRVRHAQRRPRTSRLGRGPRLQRAARTHHRRTARRRRPRGTRRVRAAVLSSGLPWPLRRVTVNLAPSGVRKGGAGLDLPIAVGLLVATGEISPTNTEGLAFCGELGLNGSLRHVPGMIALPDATAPSGLVVPLCDVREAALVRGEEAHGVATLAELTRVLRGQSGWPPTPPAPTESDAGPVPDLSDVRGQALGRRALEVAAAGPHHLLMIGPPGSGKTMLAERLPGLLPPLRPTRRSR